MPIRTGKTGVYQISAGQWLITRVFADSCEWIYEAF